MTNLTNEEMKNIVEDILAGAPKETRRLTMEEQVVADLLGDAYNKFAKLPRYDSHLGELDIDDFGFHMRSAQNILLARPVAEEQVRLRDELALRLEDLDSNNGPDSDLVPARYAAWLSLTSDEEE